MINVVLKGDDCFYLNGMVNLLINIFKTEYRQNVMVLNEFSQENIRKADIIIFHLVPGENGTCIPELKYRCKGIVIGLVDKELKSQNYSPGCYRDIVIIPGFASLSEIRDNIVRAWRQYDGSYLERGDSLCIYCQPKSLSPQQSRIMASIYKGRTMAQISRDLMISDKTIFSHKYLIMQRFGLVNNYELMRFLKNMATKDTSPNLFRDYVEREREQLIYSTGNIPS